MTRSTSAGVARPVRMVSSSRRRASMAFCMWTSASFITSSVIVLSFDESGSHRPNKGADVFAARGPADVAGLLQIERNQRDLVVHAEGQGRGVHNAQVFLQGVPVVQGKIAPRGRIEPRVGVIHTIDGIL